MVELLMGRQAAARVFSQNTSPRNEMSEPNSGRNNLIRSRRSMASTDMEMFTARSHSPGYQGDLQTVAVRMAEAEEDDDENVFDESSPLNNDPSTSSC